MKTNSLQETPKQLHPLPRALPLPNSTWKDMSVSYYNTGCVIKLFNCWSSISWSNWSAFKSVSMMLFTHTTTDPRRRPSAIVCVRKQHLAFTKWFHLMLTTIKYFSCSVIYLQRTLGRWSLRELSDGCHHNRWAQWLKQMLLPLWNLTKQKKSVLHIQLNTLYAYYLGHAEHTKEKCSHHSVGKPVCASYPVTECLPIRKRHECINNKHITTVQNYF